MLDTDVDLLRAARSGSSEALDRLFARCTPRLLALIRLRLGRDLRGRLESRDILQATLLKAFLGFDRLQAADRGSLMAWLARIAGNEIRDQVERHHRLRRDAARETPLEPALVEAVAERVHSPASRAILDQELDRLARALEELPPAHREVIVLRRLEELPWQEVAGRMERSEDACRMLLTRALVALTLRLRERS